MQPVPWSTDCQWQEINAALRHSLDLNEARLAAARRHADAVAHGLDRLAALFDQVTPVTCGVCRAPCCRHARVWLDFTDLLFLHLNRERLPPRQLRANPHQACRFLDSRGCRLARRARPWICTWYICPLQRQTLERDIPGGWIQADALRNQLKIRRDAMESAYLKAATAQLGSV